jgi:hypothetical protein
MYSFIRGRMVAMGYFGEKGGMIIFFLAIVIFPEKGRGSLILH